MDKSKLEKEREKVINLIPIFYYNNCLRLVQGVFINLKIKTAYAHTVFFLWTAANSRVVTRYCRLQ